MTVLWLLAACSAERSGTWVGNPNLSAAVSDRVDALQRIDVASGRLSSASESFALPAFSWVFDDDGLSVDGVTLPEGRFARLDLEVDRLVLLREGEPLEFGGFTYALERSFVFETDRAYTLQLAVEPLLAQLDLAGELQPGAIPSLLSGDVVEGSHLEPSPIPATPVSAMPTPVPSDPPAATPPLQGRVTLEAYPVSPGGIPTSVSCDAAAVGLAMPVAPASMEAITDGAVQEVGWCESSLMFFDEVFTSLQVDFATGTTYPVEHNGGGTCGSSLCGTLTSGTGEDVGACEVLAFCDGETATAVGVLF